LLSLDKANEAGKEKTIFLANLSHEMRTPLNAIIGMLQIYMRSRDKNEVEKEIRQIETSSKHLVSLINDILDISKIEEGMFVLEKDPFNLKTVADNVYDSLWQTAQNKKQALTIDYGSLKSFGYVGDSLRLLQVLINLVSNAIKFTPENGKIDILIIEMSRDSDKVLVKFIVDDNGVGITPDFLSNIFVAFKQAESSISKKYGGTGLGLAISQRIVEMMGGEIHVESELGKGTSFYFSIWLEVDKNALADEVTEELVETPDFSGRRLLVVDDIDINREIVCLMLEETGIISEQAENGQKAVDMIEASVEGYYDLLLMDVQMPVMDGYTATKLIRAMDREDAKKIPIFAMTANAFREDVEKALKTGMDGHIRKPIEANVLFEALNNVFNT
jgi:CheY-like chemotaxis protein